MLESLIFVGEVFCGFECTGLNVPRGLWRAMKLILVNLVIEKEMVDLFSVDSYLNGSSSIQMITISQFNLYRRHPI